MHGVFLLPHPNPMNGSTAAEIKRAQQRIAAIREEISSRLWPVNSGMSAEMFNDLMDRMALLQYNFEQRVVEDGREGDRRRGELDRRTLPGGPPSSAADDDAKE